MGLLKFNLLTVDSEILCDVVKHIILISTFYIISVLCLAVIGSLIFGLFGEFLDVAIIMVVVIGFAYILVAVNIFWNLKK